jgi:phage repressor protein C with HTH and peptisase S24 domain
MGQMSIHKLIRDGRKRLGMTETEFADAVGVTRGAVQQWEKEGGTAPKRSHQPIVARLIGLSVSELMGEARGSSLAPILAWEHESDLPAGEFIMVPRLRVFLSAGNGHDQVEIEFVKKQPQAFRADWIRQERLKPAKLASMSADGDSMEPGIFDGDSLVVDTSQDTVIDGKVFAIWYDGGERVKRLYRLPGGGLRIKSDNPLFETIEVKSDQVEHVRIIGRVVHRAGKGGL